MYAEPNFDLQVSALDKIAQTLNPRVICQKIKKKLRKKSDAKTDSYQADSKTEKASARTHSQAWRSEV